MEVAGGAGIAGGVGWGQLGLSGKKESGEGQGSGEMGWYLVGELIGVGSVLN